MFPEYLILAVALSFLLYLIAQILKEVRESNDTTEATKPDNQVLDSTLNKIGNAGGR